LSKNTSSSVASLQHAVKFAEKFYKIKFDYVIELMCTNPFKSQIDIDNSIKKLIKTKADAVIAVHKVEDNHPSRLKKIINDKIFDFMYEKPESRRQDLRPYAYVRSGAIYALTKDFLMKKNKRYGGKNTRPIILLNKTSVNIDSELVFILAQTILKNEKI